MFKLIFKSSNLLLKIAVLDFAIKNLCMIRVVFFHVEVHTFMLYTRGVHICSKEEQKTKNTSELQMYFVVLKGLQFDRM